MEEGLLTLDSHCLLAVVGWGILFILSSLDRIIPVQALKIPIRFGGTIP